MSLIRRIRHPRKLLHDAVRSTDEDANPSWFGRWLMLSPTVGALCVLLAGLIVSHLVDPSAAPGIIVGSSIAALVGSGIAFLQRAIGNTTIEHLIETENRAAIDPLTGVMNRATLMSTLNEAIVDARRHKTYVGVLFTDLDRFKVINDSLGHEVGDTLLQLVATRYETALASDHAVARFGGDEFVIISRGLTNRASITLVAEDLRAAFEDPFVLEDGELMVSPSIGIAVFDPRRTDGQSAEDLVRDADTAMYEAKRQRTGICEFDAEARDRVVSRLQIEQALSTTGIAEMVVHYQPVIDTSTNRLTGLEALVRWQNPESGLIAPSEFLPVADESGLLSRIGEHVLREACAQASLWNMTDPAFRDVGMSVNVAECQILDASFPTRVRDALEWSQLPPHQLCLELSEDLVSEHLTRSLPVLEQLVALGVRLSLDDFGTGRTTLSHLKRLNDVVSQVKIDQGFVSQLTTDLVDQAVVEAIARIAGSADLTVVAEGVETNAQAMCLEHYGIRHHQGFLYSRAIDPEVLLDEVRAMKALQPPERPIEGPPPVIAADLPPPARYEHAAEPSPSLGN